MKQPDFIVIPTQLLTDSRLQAQDRVVFGYIYWLTKLRGEKCTASNSLLAELVGTSSTSVRNSLAKLEQAGYVAKIYTGVDKKNRLEIRPLVAFSANVASADAKVARADATQVARADAQNKSIYSKSNKEEYKDLSKDKSSSTSKVDTVSLKPLFYELVAALGFDAERVRYTEQRRKKLRARLKTFSAAELQGAAKAIAGDDFLQGDNDSGKRYGTIDYLLRSDELVDRWLSSKGESADIDLSKVEVPEV